MKIIKDRGGYASENFYRQAMVLHTTEAGQLCGPGVYQPLWDVNGGQKYTRR